MEPTFPPSIVLLLTSSVLLLLAPTVHSSTNFQASWEVPRGPRPPYPPPLPFDNCLNFDAYWEAPSGPDANKFNARFWVNDTVICRVDLVEVSKFDPEHPSSDWVYMNCYTGWECRYLLLYPNMEYTILFVEYVTPYGPFYGGLGFPPYSGGGFRPDWDDESQKYLGCKGGSCDGTPFECFTENSVIQVD